ncbi:hypothetical protein DID74_00115 [Candidatus Marinamargulisbacteria bacterium SCGC AG-333-B06]|nr:hypothetical protein DID74_00115 [Candidatus Marinamargulisbacteria bacterium SCGC AG-333-B06]
MTPDLSLDNSILFLENLVSINSSSYNPSGLISCLKLIEEKFTIFKPTIESIPSANKPKNAPPIALKLTKNLTAKTTCLLCIHVDTVFDQTSPFQTFQLSHDKKEATGPGVIDAKGGIVIIWNTVALLEKSSLSADIGWTVIITTDEEIGSPKSKYILEQEAKKHTFSLVFEPPLENGNIIKERPASSNITLTTHGKAAHAGRHATQGLNAINGLIALLNTLPLTKESDTQTINLGTIQGGTRDNIIPETATCCLNARFMNPLDLDAFIKQCHDNAKTIESETGVTITVDITSLRPSKSKTKESETLYTLLKEAAEDLNVCINFENSFGVCDGNFIANQGIPVIDTMGAHGSGMHTHNETIQLNSLITQSTLAYNVIKKMAKK